MVYESAAEGSGTDGIDEHVQGHEEGDEEAGGEKEGV